jgi:hypothetical protein
MKASRFPIIAGLTVLWLGVFGPASATEEGPYPVWWSPVLELDSLDAIDARLAREIWPGDPEGLPLAKTEGETRKEVPAFNCIELERWVGEGYHGIGTNGFGLQLYNQALCRAIEMLKQAAPARRSYLREFVLDETAVAYLPAMAFRMPSCDYQCRQRLANERRIPVSQFEELVRIDSKGVDELELETPTMETRITVMARGDLNADGLDDMLVLSNTGATEGTGGWSGIYLLTREAPNAVLFVLNADKPSCRHYQCDETYDYPAILRETGPTPAD